MIEISPICILDGELQTEGEDYSFEKSNDKSVKFIFKEKGFSLRFAPSQIVSSNPIPIVWFNGIKLDYGSFEMKSYQDQGRAGVDFFFSGLPFKRFGLIPRVLMGEEEKEYKKKQIDEKRRAYEKEHGFLWK